MNILETLTLNITIILAVIGAIAFIVSVITQVIKGVGVFAKIPTDGLVLVLSIGITVAAFVAYMQYLHMTILWYMILAAIMAGFVVAFVAMYGWEKLSELWKRFGKNVD
jgi:Ca2+/Na+ antiporter